MKRETLVQECVKIPEPHGDWVGGGVDPFSRQPPPNLYVKVVLQPSATKCIFSCKVLACPTTQKKDFFPFPVLRTSCFRRLEKSGGSCQHHCLGAESPPPSIMGSGPPLN